MSLIIFAEFSVSKGTPDGVGGMIVDLVSNYIMKQKEINPFVLFIDEIHRYTRNNYDSNSNIGLTIIAREGRKKGVFLFLTTQNPHDVPSVLLGQVGTLLIHRLTHKNEVEAVQNYLSEVSVERVRNLNQGEAILTSINLIQDIMINVIASTRIHNNSTPKL
ncbi:MAG TPA: helicase HerA-like domain-containing protein [Atopostipes sp.]|nr:helicase HerA-like domain-containing protein [Atopostipes sp.]